MHSGRIDSAVKTAEGAAGAAVVWKNRDHPRGPTGRRHGFAGTAAAIQGPVSLRFQRMASWLRPFGSFGAPKASTASSLVWFMRRARQILSEISSFEDINIHDADSMLEYPTLGTLTAGFRRRSEQRKPH